MWPPAHCPHVCAPLRGGPDQRTPPTRCSRYRLPVPMSLPRLPSKLTVRSWGQLTVRSGGQLQPSHVNLLTYPVHRPSDPSHRFSYPSFVQNVRRRNPRSPLAQCDLCVGTAEHGEESRLRFITTVNSLYHVSFYVFLHAFGSGFRPTNQTTQHDDSSRSRHVTQNMRTQYSAQDRVLCVQELIHESSPDCVSFRFDHPKLLEIVIERLYVH